MEEKVFGDFWLAQLMALQEMVLSIMNPTIRGESEVKDAL